MAQTTREIMTRNPKTLEADSTVTEAARVMRDEDIGNILVRREEQLLGILTDRDLVVRCMADGGDPSKRRVGGLCTQDLVTVNADDSVDSAIEAVRSHAVRRIPVLENGKPVGIVSLGDLARDRDPNSALGMVSDAPAGR